MRDFVVVIRDATGNVLRTIIVTANSLAQAQQFAQGRIEPGSNAEAVGDLTTGNLNDFLQEFGGATLEDIERFEASTEVATAQPVVNPPAGAGTSIEQGPGGARATFGEFLTRGGIGPGQSFGRQQAEGTFGNFLAAADLQDLIAGTAQGDRPQGGFETFLGGQQVGQGREALANVFRQASGLGPGAGTSLFDTANQGLAQGTSSIGNAATSLFRSQFNPLFSRNRDFRSADSLESDFLQAQRTPQGGFAGTFTDFLRNELGLDRFL